MANILSLVGGKIKTGLIGAKRHKSGHVDGASFTDVSGKMVYDVVFATAYPDTDYSIAITATAQRVWTYENKAATGFRISSQSNSPLTGEDISWQTQEDGEA